MMPSINLMNVHRTPRAVKRRSVSPLGASGLKDALMTNPSLDALCYQRMPGSSRLNWVYDQCSLDPGTEQSQG